MFRIFEGFDELPFNFDDEEPVSSNYATEPAVDNSRKRTYNNRTRVRRPKASQFGKKNTRDEDYYQLQYLSKCCAQNHIRVSFSVETFLSKRHQYAEFKNERGRSAFIDSILDSAIRADSEGNSRYKLYFNT